MTRRIFLDTEFKNLPWTGHSELLWVGLADEDGNSWSAINADVAIDEYASDFTRSVVVPLMTDAEARLAVDDLRDAIVEFCGDPDEIWAWCPTVDQVQRLLGAEQESTAEAHRRYWDWDLQLLRTVVRPWPSTWPTDLRDLNALARSAGVTPPPNLGPHNPRNDALWNREVFLLASR